MTESPDRCMVCSRELVFNPLLPDLLEECPMCRRLFCNRCSVRRGGRDFCGPRCGDSFFFGNVDEGDSDDAEG